MFLLGGWILLVCGSWSSWALLLSEGCEGSAEPPLLSPILYGVPNSTRAESAIPAKVGLMNTLVESWNSGAVSGVQQMGSYPGVWHAIPLLPSLMTCWYSACVVHASPVATVVSALCLGVVCWIVVPSLRSRTLVPLVLWALVRCDMQSAVSGSWDVTDDVFWSPLFAATACLGRQVQAYAGAAAASLFVLRRGGGGRPSGTCHVLIGMRWVGGLQLPRQLLRSCGRSRSSAEVERLR